MATDVLVGGFIDNSRAVLDTINHIFASEIEGEIFVCGAALKLLFDGLFKTINPELINHRIYAIVPNVSSLGSPLYARFKKMACQVKVSPQAIHNLIVTRHYLLFLSVSETGRSDSNLSGVLITNDADVDKAQYYCRKLSDEAFPLQIG